MPDREKLIKLLRAPIFFPVDTDPVEVLADHLLNNGVTFATDIIVGRWIPITERLPEPFALVLTYDSTGKMINDSYMTRHKEWVGVRMNHDVTHWMPIPELPKEVE